MIDWESFVVLGSSVKGQIEIQWGIVEPGFAVVYGTRQTRLGSSVNGTRLRDRNRGAAVADTRSGVPAVVLAFAQQVAIAPDNMYAAVGRRNGRKRFREQTFKAKKRLTFVTGRIVRRRRGRLGRVQEAVPWLFLDGHGGHMIPGCSSKTLQWYKKKK